MAIITAAQNGNWSATSTWTGGVVPGPGDEARSQGFNITIDQDIVADLLYSASGGGFFINSIPEGQTRTLTCSLQTGTTVCLTIAPRSSSVIIDGDVISLSSGAGDYVINYASTVYEFDLIITGDVTTSTNSVNAIYITSSQTVGTLTVYGDVTSGGTTVMNVSQPSLFIDIYGTATASSTGSAISNTSNTVPIRVGKMVDGSNGRRAINAPFVVVRGEMNQNPEYTVCLTDDTTTLLKRWHTNSPPPSDVREGTAYGPDNLLTGTATIPPAAAVASGVSVDATTGTATTRANLASTVGTQLAAALGA